MPIIDQYIHHYKPVEIEDILKSPAWITDGQTVTSASTNTNDTPTVDTALLDERENTAGINAFSDLPYTKDIRRILDIGGGQFDVNRQYMQTHHKIELLVWDPYNRTAEHNLKIQAEIQENSVDAVTSMSVLNVIPECKIRLQHLVTAKSAMKTNGSAYFKIWPGEGPEKNSYKPTLTDDTYQANSGADRFLREVQVVFGVAHAKCHPTIPNLILANKVSDAITNKEEIIECQQASRDDQQKLMSYQLLGHPNGAQPTICQWRQNRSVFFPINTIDRTQQHLRRSQDAKPEPMEGACVRSTKS